MSTSSSAAAATAATKLECSVDVSDLKIEKKAPEAEMYDVMEGAARWEIPVHNHGLVAMVDVMPRLCPVGHTADFAIVQAARVSYGKGTKKASEDKGLVRYLARHRHTTPFEMVEFKFHVVCPMFVARQWIRHRTANVNEYSARYSVVVDRFYRPAVGDVRQQSQTNKQGGDASVEQMTESEFLAFLDKSEALYKDYERMLSLGVTREQARIGLPVSAYTEWYWKIDLHNLLHFLSLRMDPHAQKEIRDYANAMFALIKPVVPVAAQSFADYYLDSMRLTRLEIEALRTGEPLATTNKRENKEWEEKKARLGL